jgi:hypothetical protein
MGRKKAEVSPEQTEKRMNIGVAVNEKLWRHLKALAIRQAKPTGELLDRAIEEYLQKHDRQ